MILLKGKKKRDNQKMEMVRVGSEPIAHEKTLKSIITAGLSFMDNNKRNGRLYASDAGQCQRMAVLNATSEIPRMQSAASVGYYQLGNVIEDLALSGLFKQEVLLFKQFMLPDIGVNMGGYIDGIISYKGKIRVLEIKSCGSLPTKIKPAHYHQALMYSAITGFEATVLYFSRNVAEFNGTMLMRELPVETDKDKTREVVWRACYSHLCILEGVVPDKPHHMDKVSYCGFCEHKHHCWGEDVIPVDNPISPELHVKLVNEANAIVDDIMSPESVKARRTQILKFLSRSGNENAKRLLRNNQWRKFIND